MSLYDPMSITCPGCGHASNWKVYRSVNVSVDPELKEKVLQGEIQRFRCPSCELVASLGGSLLYHDVGRAFMVWFVEEDEPLADPLAGTPSELRGLLASIRTRRVRSWNALLEKVHLFDAGLDDVAFELLKIRFAQQQPALQELELRFHGLVGDELFVDALGDDEVLSAVIARANYDSSVELLGKFGLAPSRDEHWVLAHRVADPSVA